MDIIMCCLETASFLRERAQNLTHHCVSNVQHSVLPQSALTDMCWVDKLTHGLSNITIDFLNSCEGTPPLSPWLDSELSRRHISEYIWSGVFWAIWEPQLKCNWYYSWLRKVPDFLCFLPDGVAWPATSHLPPGFLYDIPLNCEQNKYALP